MKKKQILVIALVILFTLPCSAVLKEKNLGSTLSTLRIELTTYHKEQEKETASFKQQSALVRNNIVSILSKSNQNALMLYSQKPEYVFDLAYACRQATEQYREFQKTSLPFKSVINKMAGEMARYDSLITTLKTMHVATLTKQEQNDRNVCLAFAINIRRSLKEREATLTEYANYYDLTEQHLETLNDYANMCYAEIQNDIFKNVGENYFVILSKFGTYLKQTEETVEDKYKSSTKVNSQWDPKMMFGLFGFILFYAIIAIFLNFIALRYLVPKRLRTEEFIKKRPCIIYASTAITFAIIIGIIKAVVNQNFIIMACGLLVEYTWLLAVILISLLLRVDGKSIKSAFHIYAPLLIVGFIVITFRIILVPNDLANLIFPPILLICSIWQWNVIRRHNDNIPRSDVGFTYITLAIFIASVVVSWLGYTLMSVQMLIWWLMQLACILSISCITEWLHTYANKHQIESQPVTKSWFYYFVYQVVTPVLGLGSILLSVYWAAEVFNLSDFTRTVFSEKFINEENFCVSLYSIVMVIALWFLFAYIGKTARALMKHHFEFKDSQTAASKTVMGKNVINILVWGIWLIISLGIFHVSSTWLVVISGGLSTGVGFASKDIIENFYYGISLMAGRIKIGDWIECDGTRGRVASISYTSTMIEAIDGSIIAFQNSQLFTKNYKNLTRNHGYVLTVVPFGVAYGTDVRDVYRLVGDRVRAINNPFLDKNMGVIVRFIEFGDSSIDFKVLCWSDVTQQAAVESEIRENIYDVLNENKIEIPFPQRDLHVIDVPAKTSNAKA